MSGGNCRDKYPGQTFRIDYSSCKCSCILSWFWLGIVPLGGEKYTWQVYKNCVALDDGKKDNASKTLAMTALPFLSVDDSSKSTNQTDDIEDSDESGHPHVLWLRSQHLGVRAPACIVPRAILHCLWRSVLLAYLEDQGFNTSADPTTAIKKLQYSTLRTFLDDEKQITITEGALFDCGFTDINTETQYIPADGIMRTTGYIYDGPYEVWLDDTLVMSGSNCRDEYPGQTFPMTTVRARASVCCDGTGLVQCRWV